MRLLSFVIGVMSIAPLLGALVMMLPHSDVPAPPLPQLLMFGLGVGGLRMARQLWRGDARAARGLPWWGGGLLLFAVSLTLVIASPAERREAWPAFAVAAPLWAIAVAGVTWHVRRAGAAPGHET